MKRWTLRPLAVVVAIVIYLLLMLAPTAFADVSSPAAPRSTLSQLVFASIILVAGFLLGGLFRHSHVVSYGKGYDDGYADAEAEAGDAYERGYSDAYDSSPQEGA